MFIGGSFSFQIIDGKEKSSDETKDNARRIQLPFGGIIRAWNKYCSEQTQNNGDDFDRVELFFKDDATQDGSHGGGTER